MSRFEGRPLTMELAEFVACTSVGDLTPEVRHQVKRVIVDYLAATVLGSRARPAVIVREHACRTDASNSATVIGTGVRLSPAGAALANGTASHAYDVDDGYTPGGCHPSGPVVSAAFAAAERLQSSSEDLVRAVALGDEVACRLAGATHPAQRHRSFHNTALVGVFGAAAAVSALLGTDAVGVANAFGLAGAQAGGLLSFLDQGCDVKRYHTGKAGRDGLVSAELAADGLTGPTTVLESRHGYLEAFAGGHGDVDHLLGELGTTWRMMRTYNKPYPCCRHVHGAVDAALFLREEHGLRPDSIGSVKVETFALAASHDDRVVHNLLDAQMSLPYAVAAALVYGDVGMKQFEDEARDDPQLNAILEIIHVEEDEALTRAYPSTRPARVTIQADGTEYLAEVAQPLGEPDNPISDEALTVKFRRLASPIIGAQPAEDVLEVAWTLDDPARLFDVLATP